MEHTRRIRRPGTSTINCITRNLHDSGKIAANFLLCLVSLCVSVTTDAQDKPAISGFGTATIDGLKQNGEWATAGRAVFDVRMDVLEVDRKAFAILYVMNNDTHFFVGLVTETGLLDSRWLKLSLKEDLKTNEFYFNRQSGLLLQEAPGADAGQSLVAPDCCRASVSSSQGYEMLEFEFTFAGENSNSGLSLNTGAVFDLQISPASCPELPGEGSCWASEHDAFITESGNFEAVIQIVAGPDR